METVVDCRIKEATEEEKRGAITPWEAMHLFEEWSTDNKPTNPTVFPPVLIQHFPYLQGNRVFYIVDVKRTGTKQKAVLSLRWNGSENEKRAMIADTKSQAIVCTIQPSDLHPYFDVRIVVYFLTSAEAMKKLESPSGSPSDNRFVLSGSMSRDFIRRVIDGQEQYGDGIPEHDLTGDEARYCLVEVARQFIDESKEYEGQDKSELLEEACAGFLTSPLKDVPLDFPSVKQVILGKVKECCDELAKLRLQNHTRRRCTCNKIVVHSRTPTCGLTGT